MLLPFNFLIFLEILRKILTFNLPFLFYESNQSRNRVRESNENETNTSNFRWSTNRSYKILQIQWSSQRNTERERERESLYRVTILKVENKSTQSEINKSKPEA